MRCRKARWYLSARCDDTLSQRQRTRLDHHLKGCGACRREAFFFSEIGVAASRMETVSVRPDFNLRLRAAIRRAEVAPARISGWRERFAVLRLRPALVAGAAVAVMLVAVGSYQYSSFNSEQAKMAEQVRRGEEGRLARARAMGLPTGEQILPAGWTPVDGFSPEMRKLQEQYLAAENLPRNYIIEADNLNDPLSQKPRPLYVMPTVPSEQMVRKVSY